MKKILSIVAAAILTLTIGLGIGSTASASGLNVGAPNEFYTVAPDTIWTMVEPTGPDSIQGVSIPLTQTGPMSIAFATDPGMLVIVGNNPAATIASQIQTVNATTNVTTVPVSLEMNVPVPFEVLGGTKIGSAVVVYQGYLIGTPLGAEWSGTDATGNNVYLYWNNPGEVNDFMAGTIAQVPATSAIGNTKEGWISTTQDNLTAVSKIPANDGWMEFQVPNTVGATLTTVSGNQTTTGTVISHQNIRTFSPPPLIMR